MPVYKELEETKAFTWNPKEIGISSIWNNIPLTIPDLYKQWTEFLYRICKVIFTKFFL